MSISAKYQLYPRLFFEPHGIIPVQDSNDELPFSIGEAVDVNKPGVLSLPLR